MMLNDELTKRVVIAFVENELEPSVALDLPSGSSYQSLLPQWREKLQSQKENNADVYEGEEDPEYFVILDAYIFDTTVTAWEKVSDKIPTGVNHEILWNAACETFQTILSGFTIATITK